jgi:hypothetical protein
LGHGGKWNKRRYFGGGLLMLTVAHAFVEQANISFLSLSLDLVVSHILPQFKATKRQCNYLPAPFNFKLPRSTYLRVLQKSILPKLSFIAAVSLYPSAIGYFPKYPS